jgi:endonuclease/exonuclease/phosphatase family metal-dependent hydrolase
MTTVRVARLNVETLDDDSSIRRDRDPTLAERIGILRPAIERIDADVLRLQEVDAQAAADGSRSIAALETLPAGTRHGDDHVTTTHAADGDPERRRNLVVVSRFPVANVRQIDRNPDPEGSAPKYRTVTAVPAAESKPGSRERPTLGVDRTIDDGRTLHVLNVHTRSRVPTDVAGQQVPSATTSGCRRRGGRRATSSRR